MTTTTVQGRSRLLMMLLLALAMVATACGGSDTTGDRDADTATDAPAEADAAEEDAAEADAGEDETADGELTAVSLQLQWFTQGQFAGYFAAVDQGFYEEVGLDVTILEGGVDI
ncbi:MAG TPA: ABC transporter substrate-binding protein, partial [Euzebya sp.]|nr:ABC transporter substrate-binding protein [Euzebya sp.]